MKRFWFNLLWYLGVVVIAELLPIGIFFRLHLTWGVGNLVPQIVSSAAFLILLVVQAFLHFHFLKRFYPERGNKNYLSTLGLTALAYLTLWVIITILILWAMNSG